MALKLQLNSAMNWTFSGLLARPLFYTGGTAITVGSLLLCLATLAVTFLSVRTTRWLVLRKGSLLMRRLPNAKVNLGFQYAVGRIVGYVIFVLGSAISLQNLGINLTTVALVTGAAGIGIGFGLQQVAHDFASGLIILLERPIEIGDRVEVADIAGKVVKIGTRSTSILTNDNIVMVVSNSQILSNNLLNWTQGGDHRVRFRVPVSVSFESDPRRVKELLLEVAAENEHVLKEPLPSVVCKEFNEYGIDFELRVWSVSLSHRPGVLRSQINFAIWEKFKEHGVEFAFLESMMRFQELALEDRAGAASKRSVDPAIDFA